MSFFNWEVVNLKYNLKGLCRKQKLVLTAFTSIEALIGFILFSILLMFYLPSYQRELGRMQHLKMQTERWQLLYDLSKAQTVSEQHQRTAAYQLLNQDLIDYDCTLENCQAQFSNGEVYEMVLQKIE